MKSVRLDLLLFIVGVPTVLSHAESIQSAGQLWTVGCERLIAQKTGTDDVEAYMAIATCLMTEKQSGKAIEYLNRALKVQPNDPQILTSLAMAQATSGQGLGVAGETFWRVAQMQPTKENLYLAAFHLEWGERYLAAIEPYRKLVALQPEEPLYLTSLGKCLSRSGKTDEADKVFSDALIGLPNNVLIEREYALHLARQKRFDEALKQANSALKADTKSPDSLSVLGQVFEMQDRKDEAAETYETALRIDPDQSGIRIKLTRICSRQGRYEDVIVNGLKVVKKHPDHREVHAMLLQAFEKTKQNEMADHERMRLKEIDANAASNVTSQPAK